MHLRAVGSLLRLLERWLVAQAVNTPHKALWHVPDSWHLGNKLMANQFETFLKRTWDTQLFSLLDVGSRGISWWNTLPEVCIALLAVANAETYHCNMFCVSVICVVYQLILSFFIASCSMTACIQRCMWNDCKNNTIPHCL